MFKIGTFADWFGVGLLEGLKESEKCGATGVQVYAWNELDPRTANPAFVAEVKATAKACHQEIVALCGELGGHGLEIAADNPNKIAYLKAVIDLAAQFESIAVTTHIGIVPKDDTCDKYKIMQEACEILGRHAVARGVKIAIETGPEPVDRLKKFVLSCPSGGVGINYDPANLVMVTGVDEVEGVLQAGSSIVHTHAKDGVRYQPIATETAYEIFATGGIDEMHALRQYYEETPLGKGQVRWLAYLRALQSVGYNGYLTIEREAAKGAGDDIRMAVDFLKQQIEQV